MTRHVVYLHGFASSPDSFKARWLAERLAACGFALHAPDLNRDGFERMSLRAQSAAVGATLAALDAPAVVVGSSFGGFLAGHLAEHEPRIAGLVLLAPAFAFVARLAEVLGREALERWRASGWLRLPERVDGRQRRLHYALVEELSALERRPWRRQLPVRIVHGIDDATVPYAASVDYLRANPRARLLLVPDDHALHRTLPEIWEQLVSLLDDGGS